MDTKFIWEIIEEKLFQQLIKDKEKVHKEIDTYYEGMMKGINTTVHAVEDYIKNITTEDKG